MTTPFLNRFETTVFLGLDGLTGKSQSLGFGDVFRFDALGDGYAGLYLRSVPEPTASLFLAAPFKFTRRLGDIASKETKAFTACG